MNTVRGQHFDVDNLPNEEDFELFKKNVPTKMVRVEGPFTVDTSEGPTYCQDGWLAVDSHGSPYPISVEEQEAIYEPYTE